MIILNAVSVLAANRLNIFFTICKVTTILIIVVTGIIRLGQGMLLEPL